MIRFGIAIVLLALLNGVASHEASAQSLLSQREVASVRVAKLQQQLTTRLRATSLEQQSYIRFVVGQVNQGKLPIELVVAAERYAIRRDSRFPLPTFEQIMRGLAMKQGVTLPPIRSFGNVGPEGVRGR